jgi:hypothetical protein
LGIKHYQMEETYLFSSLLARLKEFSQGNQDLATRTLLATFWRIYEEERLFKSLIENLENEIKNFDPDPTRESNRTKKVFACAAYRAIAKKPKHETILENYIGYAMDSKDWLGQPRIACCVSFLKDEPVAKEAKNYLKENYSVWLSDERDDFISVALVGLGKEVSKGDLQKTIEHVESKIDVLPLSTICLYFIGISEAVDLPNTVEIEDKLYQGIKDQLTFASEEEEQIFAATAIYITKYHRISGYYEKYAGELKETLALKDEFSAATRKAKSRSLLLCITLVFAIGLLCLLFYLPTIVTFEKNPSAFGRILLAINSKKGYALGTSLVLISYILGSFFKSGDPVLGLIEWVKSKVPGLFKEDKRG